MSATECTKCKHSYMALSYLEYIVFCLKGLTTWEGNCPSYEEDTAKEAQT